MRHPLLYDISQLENKSRLLIHAEALFFINAATFHLTCAYNKEQGFSARVVIDNVSVLEIIYCNTASFGLKKFFYGNNE